MFDSEKAAKYFLIGWIKNWSLLTYLKVIEEDEEPPYPELLRLYPWLPTKTFIIFGRTTLIRRYVAEMFFTLNNKIWDTHPDNQAILLLWPHVVKCRGDDLKAFGKDRSEGDELRASRSDYRRTRIGLAIETKRQKSYNRSNSWKACK